jgi:hypothetical protein
LTIGIEHPHIKQGVISLPDGIGAFGTMAVDELVAIAKRRRAVLRMAGSKRRTIP